MADDGADSEAPGVAFAAYLKKGEIRLQICGACGKQIFFPRTICPHCGGDKLEWRPVSGRASVYSTTTVRQKPERGGDYNVSIVEFAEGARMLSRVDGVAPAEVKIGMPVEAGLAEIDGAPQIVFTPARRGPVMSGASLRGAAALVGTGLAGLGAAPGYSHLDLLGLATRDALADAGLALTDVDGLFTANMANILPTLVVGEYLGVKPAVAVGTNTGGNSFVDHLLWAALALREGLCNVALVCYGSNQRTGGGSGPDLPPYEAPYRPREPISSYALAAARHMFQYGTTREQLAAVVVASRQWAALNPAAFLRDPVTIEDVLKSRMICDPLSLLDCCLVTDGAGAVVLTRAERARDLRRKPVYLLGCASAQTHRQISQMPDLTVTAAAESGPRAFAMAGLAPKDVDVLQLYDAFTINVILFLEDLGFCKKGEGGALAASGAIAPGGRLPVNTNGGGLSCVHPGMYGIFTLIEAAAQLRGEAGARQVPGAEVALAHGNGGLLSAQSTAILGVEATL